LINNEQEDSMNEITAGTALDLKSMVRINPGRIASRRLVLPVMSSPAAREQEWELYAMDQEETISSETSPQPQFIHVLEGELHMVVDGQKSQLSAGASIFVPADTWHEFAADTGCKFLKIRF
jgi:quercetin dioxygenase-like cupin family protein